MDPKLFLEETQAHVRALPSISLLTLISIMTRELASRAATGDLEMIDSPKKGDA